MDTFASIQIAYKTTAWFAANPSLVLKAGQMCVKNDASPLKLYIGDGVTALASLPVFTITLTLADVLTNGAATGDIDITSDNGKAILTINGAGWSVAFNNGGVGEFSSIEGDNTQVKVSHNIQVIFDSPLVNHLYDVQTDGQTATRNVKITGTNGNGKGEFRHQAINPTASGQHTALFAGSDGELYQKNDGNAVVKIATATDVSNAVSGKEDSSNKTDTMAGNETSSVKFLSSKGVYDWVLSLGYITSSALSPYLTSASAALTYQVILTATNLGSLIAGFTAKSTPIDADMLATIDSADSNKVKKTTYLEAWTNYFKGKADALYKPTFTENTAFNKNFGTGTTNIPEIGSTLGNSKVVETDSNGKLITATKGTAYNKAFGTGSGDVCEGNDSRLTNARGRSIYAKDNTTSTYTGSTGDNILKTISLPANTLGTNSILEVFANFTKTGTAGNPAFGVYIGTGAAALTGGFLVQYIQPGSTSLQSGIWVRLANKNSLTSTNTKGISQVASSILTSQTIGVNNRNFDFSQQLYIHIYATGANAADTQGITDYQVYIDN